MGQNFSDRGLKKSIDWKLVITYLLLILIGWVNIYASIHSDGPSSIFDFGFRCGKQFCWILTALVLAALILFVCPARLWESASFPLYLITLVLLVAVICHDLLGFRLVLGSLHRVGLERLRPNWVTLGYDLDRGRPGFVVSHDALTTGEVEERVRESIADAQCGAEVVGFLGVIASECEFRVDRVQ